MRRFVAGLFAAVLAGLTLLLSACGQGASPAASSDGKVQVVASTNVYGDVAKAVGGGKVAVSSIVSRSSQDPHSYEATGQDKLLISKAAVLIDNGGGYDDFLQKMAADAGVDSGRIITASAVSGLPGAPAAGAHGSAAPGFNEHVWYSFDAMGHVADALADKLGQADSADAGTFRTNADSFKQELKGLQQKVADLKGRARGAAVAITEPVPLYLLQAAGLQNKTPEGYSAAIEAGNDVPPAELKAVTDLLAGRSVKLLAYNEQTEGPQTRALKATAENAGVPVVDFSETLPEGKSYLQWMSGNVDSLAKVFAG